MSRMAPGMVPLAMSALSVSPIACRRGEESPTLSGGVMGSGSASAPNETREASSKADKASRIFMVRSPHDLEAVRPKLPRLMPNAKSILAVLAAEGRLARVHVVLEVGEALPRRLDGVLVGLGHIFGRLGQLQLGNIARAVREDGARLDAH